MTKLTITGQGRAVRFRNAHSFEIFSVLEFVMSKCSTKVALRGMFVALLAIGFQATGANTSFADDSEESKSSTNQVKMATFDNAGETHFALSLKPQISIETERASNVVVYIDTSASQSGEFKRDSIATLKHIIKNLNADDLIQIVAVDLDPVPMTKGFVSPDSEDLNTALGNLSERVPLGSTDMEAMLVSASKAFPKETQRNNNVIYIGDGVSRGSLLHSEIFGELISGLTKNKISVSSFAIGPARNNEIMAALANNTGGNLFIDSDEQDVRVSAVGLVNTIHGAVLWPVSGQWGDSVLESFPSQFPPLRTDRDNIILGSLADRNNVALQLTGIANGNQENITWQITPELANTEFSFLPGMIEDARKDSGLTLPTIGSEGLREFARVRTAEANRLSDLGETALAAGDRETARKLASAAINLSADPANTQADLLAMAATYKVQDDDDPFGSSTKTKPAPAAAKPVSETPAAKPAEETPAATPAVKTPAAAPAGGAVTLPMAEETLDGGLRMIQEGGDEIGQLLQDAKGGSTDLLLTEEQRVAIINQKITQQVQYESKRARQELRTNPDIAIERLKNMLEIIDQTTDLYPDTRSTLRHSIESSLLSSRQEKIAFDERQALADINIATAGQLKMEADRIARSQEEVSELINRYNSLLQEGEYSESLAVTEKAFQIAPYDPAVIVSNANAHFAKNYAEVMELRRQKEYAFQSSMFSIEQATIPFPGDPKNMMLWPDADEWRKKVIRRKKYQNIRLTGSATEEAILDALNETADLNYDERPWSEVEEELEIKYGINIVLTSSASDDSLTEDELITENLSGIRFKNALRIMLEKYNATFVVKDEVLKIISLDDAEDVKWFVTNVYNVGDLVAPKTSGGGGFGGGGFGGGGGGMFCIQDTEKVSLVTDKPASVDRKPQAIVLTDINDPTIAWSNYFGETFANQADVRATAKKLMKERNADQAVTMILAAIQHDQFQPWMHEALVLAMQISGRPQADIERALMSAVDMSEDDNDILIAAQYMARNGMEKRAIRLLKGYALNNPTRTEPFVIGLRAAQTIGDVEAIKWATTGVLSQEWPDHPEIVRQAQFAATAILNNYRENGQADELAAFETKLQAAKERDCYIEVSWTGDADLDLYVVEPGGTTCSRLAKRTRGGGILMRDSFSQKAGASGVVSEKYILPKGFAGDYQLVIKRVWGTVTSGKATVSIHNHYNSPRAASMTKQVEIDDKGAMVLFALDQGRRTGSLEDHEIETVVRNQMIANRNVLAQELSEGYSSGAASDYFGGLLSGVDNGNLAGPLNGQLDNRGVVGYQPIITQVPEGTFFTVNHATTADRLHVLISVSPNFNAIQSVTTFNILGDADTASGLSNSGGGQGGGGQGGGGGGFGGGGGGGGFQ